MVWRISRQATAHFEFGDAPCERFSAATDALGRSKDQLRLLKRTELFISDEGWQMSGATSFLV